MRFSVGCEIGYEVTEAATLIFNIEAMRGGRQRVLDEQLTITPNLAADEKTAEESGNRYLRLTAPRGLVQLRYSAQIELDALHQAPAVINEVPIATLPLDTLPFINPSRYCPSDQLARFANRQFGNVAPGFGRVVEICNWINAEVDYLFGTSDTTTTAADTFSLRAGVCRDFAHLGITMCRAMDIPARYVSAYAFRLDPPDFHATFEAYLGGRWYLFDATRKAALDGLIRIGVGRDAAEVSFSSFFGKAEPDEMKVSISSTDRGTGGDLTTQAVSLSER